MSDIIHASCVAIDKEGLLIIGGSGSGKSSLALQLLAFGAELVSDDRTQLSYSGGRVHAQAPDTIKGLIEARGVGILHAPFQSSIPIKAIVDLDQIETERFPKERNLTLLGLSHPLFYKVEAIHFAASLWHMMRHGRSLR